MLVFLNTSDWQNAGLLCQAKNAYSLANRLKMRFLTACPTVSFPHSFYFRRTGQAGAQNDIISC